MLKKWKLICKKNKIKYDKKVEVYIYIYIYISQLPLLSDQDPL